MNQKHYQNIYHANVNVNLMEENFNSDQWWNSDKLRCECKKHNICEKIYIWNPATCNCEN